MVRWRDYEENAKGPDGDYGVPTGSANGFFVVDLDVRPEKDGTATFEAMGECPETLTVSTPSGGFHLYFQIPAGVVVRNSVGALGEGIDIRGEGGFVVGPGSHHRSGGIYEALNDLDPAPPPAWLVEALAKIPAPAAAGGKPARHLLPEGSPEEAEAVAEAVRICQAAEPLERDEQSSQDSSAGMFRIACRLIGLCLPEDALAFIIAEHVRSDIPWTEREILHKLDDAARVTADEPKMFLGSAAVDRMAGRVSDSIAAPRLVPDETPHTYGFALGDRTLSGDPATEIAADLYSQKDWAGVLSFDLFKNRIVATKPPVALDAEGPAGLSDDDITRICGWFRQTKKVKESDVRSAISPVAKRRSYHPVREYLRRCAMLWDGVPRLDRVFPEYFKTADTAYERGVGPRWFISMVARAINPGCQSDCTPILEGDQGIGKTTGFRALVPVPDWYADCTSSIENKDFLECLRGVWLAGFDELDSMGKGSVTKVKTTLTAIADTYRPSYGRYVQTFLRECGFCGTTNSTGNYFKDRTGGRRMWPLRVLKQIDVGRIEADRDQLWGEAAVRFFQGEAWHVDSAELEALCTAQQAARLDEDPWEETISTWLEGVSLVPVEVAPTGVFAGAGVQIYDASKGVTTRDVLTHAIRKDADRQNNGDSQRVATILKRLGWTDVRAVKTKGVVANRYRRVAAAS